jgi:hypothetical protein
MKFGDQGMNHMVLTLGSLQDQINIFCHELLKLFLPELVFQFYKFFKL